MAKDSFVCRYLPDSLSYFPSAWDNVRLPCVKRRLFTFSHMYGGIAGDFYSSTIIKNCTVDRDLFIFRNFCINGTG
jgi:hypothetical protein